MVTKNAKVISLSQVRALRETFETLHSPKFQEIIYSGAMNEFKRVITPVLRALLSSKNAPPAFQDELIAVLARVYASHHVDAQEVQTLLKQVLPR